MKKFSLIAIVVLLLLALVACSDATNEEGAEQQPASPSQQVTEETSMTPTESSSATMSIPPVEPEVSGEVAKDGADYMEWTASEWNQASEEDKEICASVYLIMDDPDAVKLSEEEFDVSITEAVAELEQLFAENPDKTLEEINESAEQ
jgi:hypothetical protein